MSMTGWTQADIDAYKTLQAFKTSRRIAQVASEPETGNLVAVKTQDATESKRNRYLKPKQPKGQPNKTEADYNFRFLGGQGLFEGVTFRLEGGSKYTPDWIWFSGDKMVAVECKGAYRFGSEGRALTAFLECRARFKRVRFVWMQKQADGQWVEKHKEVTE